MKCFVLQDFSACQGLLFRTGQHYIMRRITRFNTKIVPQDRVDFVTRLLRDFSMWQILDVSKGAAAFYMWVSRRIFQLTILPKIFNFDFCNTPFDWLKKIIYFV